MNKKRVAIVQDCPELIGPLEEALESFGYETISLRGDEPLAVTVEKIRAFEPCAMFLDHDLETYSGKDVAQALGSQRIKLIGTYESQQYVDAGFGLSHRKYRLAERYELLQLLKE